MVIQEKGSRGSELIPMETLLMTDRTVFVEGEISPEAAVEFTKQVMILNRKDAGKPISVLINSPGGEINSGMLMYDVIQSSAAPIRTVCIGHAYSMAALLFASGIHGRYMLAHSELMLHEPLLGSRIGGNASTIKSVSDSLLETKRKINSILAAHTGRTEQEVEEAVSFEHFFTAKECLEFGLCDEIVGFDKIMREDLKNGCR